MTVVDPVCGMEFDDANAAASLRWKDRTYWFCTDACKDDFEKEPARYEAVSPGGSPEPRVANT